MDFVRIILQQKKQQEVYANLLRLKKENNLMKVYGSLQQLSNHPIVNLATNSNITYKYLDSFREDHNLISSKEIYGELGWLLFCITKNSQMINNFLNKKLEFEGELINSNFDKADEKLEEIKIIFGYSRWYFDNKFLVAQLIGGDEQNWSVLQSMNKEIKDFLPAFYVDLVSKKNEDNFTYSMFVEELNNRLNTLKVSDNFSKYFKIIVNSYKFDVSDIDFLRDCLYIENLFPIIDRFLFLKSILISHINMFFDGKYKKTWLKLLNEIIKYFPNDIELNNLVTLFGRTNNVKLGKNEEQLDKYVEMFQQENYHYCTTQFFVVLRDFPLELNICIMYIKSAILLKKDVNTLTNNIILDIIIKNLFNIFSFNKEFDNSLDALIKFAITLNTLPISGQILAFLSYLRVENINDNLFLIQLTIHSKYFAPQSISLINYLNLQLLSFNEHLDYQGYLIHYQNITSEINNKIKQTSFEKQIIDIKNKIHAGCFQEVIELTTDYNEANELVAFQREELLFLKFNCLIILEKMDEAIILYVNNKFENIYLVHRFNTKHIVDYLENYYNFLDIISIEHIIFAKLSNKSHQDIHTLVNAYLQKHEYNLPSEMILSYESLNHKDICFFYILCGIDIIKYFVELDQEIELNKERLFILDKLITLDRENEKEYLKEYSKIRQQDKIRKILENSNTSKITLNLRGFKNSIIPIVNEQYKRYTSVAISKNDELNTLSYIDGVNTDLSISHSKYNNMKFEAFKSIFGFVKHEFLSNEQFGLDGELSTRIRHGTLVNKLRTIFESHNLLFIKENNKYVSNNYWFKNKSEKELSLFKTIMSNFSNEVDSEIIYIKDEEIQIYDKSRKQNGLFKFDINDSILQEFFTQIKDKSLSIDDFISELLDFLTEWTKQCLVHIKEHFKNTLKNKFNNKLEKLKSDLDTCCTDITYHQFKELKSSIDECRSQLMSAFNSISEWFTFGQINDNDLLSFDIIIQTSVDYINKTRAMNLKPNVKYDYQDYDDILGHTVDVDIFNILFDNAIMHSGVTADCLQIDVSVSVQNGMVIMLVKNNLSPAVDQIKLQYTFTSILERWNLNDLSNVNHEGNSGYNKIRRILNSYSPNENNLLEYSIENNDLEVRIIISGVKDSTYE